MHACMHTHTQAHSKCYDSIVGCPFLFLSLHAHTHTYSLTHTGTPTHSSRCCCCSLDVLHSQCAHIILANNFLLPVSDSATSCLLGCVVHQNKSNLSQSLNTNPSQSLHQTTLWTVSIKSCGLNVIRELLLLTCYVSSH